MEHFTWRDVTFVQPGHLKNRLNSYIIYKVNDYPDKPSSKQMWSLDFLYIRFNDRTTKSNHKNVIGDIIHVDILLI